MPKDDISHLPPDVQASIKAAKETAKKKGTPSQERGSSTIPPQAREFAQAVADRAAKKTKTYTVQAGDSLSKIAKELLGDAARWPEIFDLNKDQISDPNVIRVGQELRIP